MAKRNGSAVKKVLNNVEENPNMNSTAFRISLYLLAGYDAQIMGNSLLFTKKENGKLNFGALIDSCNYQIDENMEAKILIDVITKIQGKPLTEDQLAAFNPTNYNRNKYENCLQDVIENMSNIKLTDVAEKYVKNREVVKSVMGEDNNAIGHIDNIIHDVDRQISITNAKESGKNRGFANSVFPSKSLGL